MSGHEAAYTVTALGTVSVSPSAPRTDRSLTAARRQLLALLVAAGPEGIEARQLARAIDHEKPLSDAALRMSVARLRDHLPDDAIPASEGGHYVLNVPVDLVDVWHVQELAAARDLPELSETELVAVLRPDEPFNGVRPSGLIEDATYEIRAAQRTVLARIATERPDLLSARLVPALLAHCADDPWNERLVLLTAIRVAQAGDRRGALDLIATTRREFVRTGLGISRDLEQLEGELLDGKVPEISPDTHSLDHSLPVWLAELRATELLGSTEVLEAAKELLERNDQAGTLVLTGPSGIGKTRALAELAELAHQRGWAALYIAPTSAPPTAFGAVSAAVPSLSTQIGRILEAEHDAEARRARLWSTVRESLGAIRPGRPMALLVDDAQWLDSYSVAFLTHLLGARPDRRLAIVIAGRSDQESIENWQTLLGEARRRGARQLELLPLGAAEIRKVVEQRCRTYSAVVRSRLARDLVDASRGIPGVALALLSAFDPKTGRFPDIEALGRPGSHVVMLTDPTLDALRVGGAAATLARDFSAEEVIELLDGDAECVLAGIDWLLRHDLLLDLEGGRYQSCHALIDAAFIARTPAIARARWHAVAARSSQDEHEAARHYLNALPVVSTDLAVQALGRSARKYFEDGLFHEAAREFASIESLAPDSLELADAIRSARSSDLAGHHAEADSLRRRHWKSALSEPDHSLALDLATSGLPEAEPIDGSPAVVELLTEIAVDRLGRTDRWRHARHLARQSAIVGRLDDAALWADSALGLAETKAEQVASVLTARFVASATSDPAARQQLLAAVRDDRRLSPELRAEYHLVRAIDLYEAGRVRDAQAALEELGRVAGRPVVRVWHGMLFAAMMTSDAGDEERAERLRQQARDFALDAGLAEADNAYLIGTFAGLVAKGAAGDLAGAYDAGLLDPTENLIMGAGISKVLHDAGRVEEALGLAEAAVRNAVAAPVSQAAVVLALSAPALGLSRDPELKQSALELLLGRGNSLLIVGAGAACLGPVRRYAAELADETDASRYWNEADELVREAGLRSWYTMQ